MSAQTPSWKLAVRAIFRALTFLLPFAFAGRLDWWRDWLFVGSLLLIAGVSFAVLRRKNPTLMRRRLEWQPGVKRFERFVLAATIIGFLSFYGGGRPRRPLRLVATQRGLDMAWHRAGVVSDSYPFTWRSPRIPSSKGTSAFRPSLAITSSPRDRIAWCVTPCIPG
jgi:hypothetical protein